MYRKQRRQIYALCVFQILLIIWGIFDCMVGNIIVGIFQIILNTVLIFINRRTIKRYKKLELQEIEFKTKYNELWQKIQ
jgi:Flp pilus assembly protein TadB